MKSILITMLVLYIGICIVLFVFQRDLLYFPQPATPVSDVAAISFDSDGEQLRGWVVNEGRDKALMYYGGNAENIANNIGFFKDVLSDYSVYLIPYRGYGNSTGYPTEEYLYHDALYIFDRVNVNHQQIALMGRSLGSGVATYVAANRKVTKLVLITPFDSIANVAKSVYWMLPVNLLLKDKYLSMNRVEQITAPTYIFIAEYDQVIPRARTESLIAQFSEQLEATILITGASHNDISQYRQYVTELQRALD